MLIERINYNKTRVSVVRDDLFPWFFGGNKARKMVEIISEIEEQGCNAIVTTGGIQSNLCRVVALAAASKGWKCTLVLHGSEKQFMKEGGNALIMRLSGVNTVFVTPDQIAESMDSAMHRYSLMGLRPYYLFGGGHNKPGVMAYKKAINELKQTLPENEVPDFIFLASGTGSTQAGLIIGCNSIGWKETKIYGISVARNKEKGEKSVLEAIGFLDDNAKGFSNEILFFDDYHWGGYGQSDGRLWAFIQNVAEQTGVVLDPTYSAKAFWGMMEIIVKKDIRGNVFFWHTGGLLNLMA